MTIGIEYLKVGLDVISFLCNFRRRRNAVVIGDLRFHPIFASITKALKYEITSNINSMGLDAGREKILQDLLNYKFTILKKNLLTLINRQDLKSMSTDQLRIVCIQIIEQCHQELYARCNTPTPDAVPKPIVEKFFSWYIHTIKQMQHHVESVCISPIHKNNASKIYAIFTHINSINVTITIEAAETIVSANGELTGISYKGATCQ